MHELHDEVLPLKLLCFFFDAVRIRPTDTPMTLKMVDGDFIDVMPAAGAETEAPWLFPGHVDLSLEVHNQDAREAAPAEIAPVEASQTKVQLVVNVRPSTGKGLLKVKLKKKT